MLKISKYLNTFLITLFLFIFSFPSMASTSKSNNMLTYDNHLSILNKTGKIAKSEWEPIKNSLLMIYLWQLEFYPYNKFNETGKKWIKICNNEIKGGNGQTDVKLSLIFSNLIINDSIAASNIEADINDKKNNNPYILLANSFLNTNYMLGGARTFYNWDKEKALQAVKSSPDNSFIYAVSNYVAAECLRGEKNNAAISNSMENLDKAIGSYPQELLFNVKKAHYLLIDQKFDEASRIFDEIDEKYPNLDFCASIIGYYYDRADKYLESSGYYEKAIRLSKGFNPYLYRYLEKIYIAMQNYSAAINMYENAVKLYPYSLDPYFNLYFIYKDAQTPTEKILQLLTKANEHFPANTDINIILASTYMDNYKNKKNPKDLEHAIAQYKKAIKTNGKIMESYENLGAIYSSEQRLDEAESVLKQALKVNPNFINAYYTLVTINIKKNKLDTALQYARKIIKLDSDSVVAYNLMGIIYRMKKEYNNAIISLNKALAKNYKYVDAIINLGDVYYEQKNYKKALELYKDAEYIEPYNEYIALGIANSLSEMGDYKNSVKFFVRSILINPKSLDTRNNLGNLYIKQKKLDQAVNEFKIILKIDPKYATAYYNLACVYALANKKPLAFDCLQKAIAMDKKLKEIAINDPDLDNIRKDKKFLDIIKK